MVKGIDKFIIVPMLLALLSGSQYLLAEEQPMPMSMPLPESASNVSNAGSGGNASVANNTNLASNTSSANNMNLASNTSSADNLNLPSNASSSNNINMASNTSSANNINMASNGSSAPTPADAAQFQDWLKSNGPPATATAPTPVAMSTSPQPFMHPRRRHRMSRPPFMASADNNNSPVISPTLTLQQSEDIMLKSAPQSPPASPESTAAFNAMMQKNVPLSPEQVVRLRQFIDRSQRAASIPANIPPKPVSTTLMINLAPGTTPPAIRLAQGYVSSLVFVDSSGSPWPVASYDIGDPKATSIQWDGKSNIMLIQAVSPYSDSNLVIRLVGLPTPITLELVSGQRVVDYRADIHVAGIGPNTKDLPTGVNLPASANQLLLNILDGIAPSGSKVLTVTGGDCQAWLFADKMYLRTRYTILSPGWVGKMVSPDGMNAYEIQRTSSVLVSQYGEPIELKIEGF
jgi:intracellular multiplication protein IcmK